MNFFAYDGPLMTVLRKTGNILITNVLFLLCSVPVVTAGASLCAVFDVVVKNLQGDKDHVWKIFFRSFRRNWRQTLPAWLILLLIAGVLLADIMIFRTILESGNIMGNLYVLFYIPGVLLILYALWLFALIARFENTLKACMKNALIILFRHFDISLLVLLLLAFFSAATYIVPISALVTPILFLWLSWALMNRAFKRYGTEDEESTGTTERERRHE